MAATLALVEESRARRLTGWKIFQQYTGNMIHHDQSCDRASHWTSVTSVCTFVLVYFAAWVVCLRSVSLNWMSRASPCRRVSPDC